jgi:cyclophilin family peptidyl-prolyl cis-trans isomerase
MKRIILNFVSPLILSIVLFTACQPSTTQTNTEEVNYQNITNETKEEVINTPPTQNSDEDSILAIIMDKDVIVAIETSLGTIKVKLYNETPFHKANFIKLCHNNFYNDIIFHRVINNFMIQAGDPNSKAAVPGETYGNGGPGYTIPAEFVPHLRHKKGALAAARLGDMQNPRKESSGSQFYICHVETP